MTKGPYNERYIPKLRGPQTGERAVVARHPRPDTTHSQLTAGHNGASQIQANAMNKHYYLADMDVSSGEVAASKSDMQITTESANLSHLRRIAR